MFGSMVWHWRSWRYLWFYLTSGEIKRREARRSFEKVGYKTNRQNWVGEVLGVRQPCSLAIGISLLDFSIAFLVSFRCGIGKRCGRRLPARQCGFRTK